VQHRVLLGPGRVVGQLNRLRPALPAESREPDADVRHPLLRSGEPDAGKRTIRQHSQIRGVVLHSRGGQQRLAPAGFVGGAQHAVRRKDVCTHVCSDTAVRS
jgi:hypothetical protein